MVHSIPLTALPSDLGTVPQFYRSDAAMAGVAHPLLRELAERCRLRWPGLPLTIECQTLELKPGHVPGIPVWQRLPASVSGEVALACLATEALVQWRPHAEAPPADLPRDGLCFVSAGVEVRFRAATTAQACVVALLRPADQGRVHNRHRHGARVFMPRPRPADHPLPEWAARRDLRFTSRFEVLAPMPAFTQTQIAQEPALSGASVAFAREVGGPITRAWLDRLPAEWTAPGADVVIANKRDELSPGWYSCLVHWHMDGTSRSAKRADGTPDLRNPVRRAEQIAACVGPSAPTGMLEGDLAMPEVPVGVEQGVGGAVWQRLILDDIAAGRLRQTVAPTGALFSFGWGVFHNCSRAEVPGWRMFLKIMRGRGDQPRNAMPERATLAWPSDGDEWPSDPCGVFPQELPC